MSATDLQNKTQIDAILNAYLSKLGELEKKRNKIVSDFLDILKEKRIKQIRDSIR